VRIDDISHIYGVYRQCLRAMGINDTLGCDAPEELQHIKSGEDFFLNQYLKKLLGDELVIFDVGANEGRYAEMASSIFPDGKVYCFEPHPKSYQRLIDRNLPSECFQLAVGAKNEKCTLFERVDHPDGSEMASVHESVITELHGVDSIKIEVEMKTIDKIMEENNISAIDFLKVDVEGHELAVIQGAKQAIDHGQLKVIQYEFNHPNIVSRVFMRDFRNELPNYDFFRLLENGMLPVLDHPIFQEIFGYQNIVAVHQSFSPVFRNDLLL